MTVIPGLVEFGSLEQVYPLVITLLKRLGAWGSRRRLFGLYGFFLCHFFLRLLPSVLYLDAGDIHSLVRHLGEIVFISLLYPVFIVYVWKLPKLMLLIKILQRSFAECNYCYSLMYFAIQILLCTQIVALINTQSIGRPSSRRIGS